MARGAFFIANPFTAPEYFCEGRRGHYGAGIRGDQLTPCPMCTGEEPEIEEEEDEDA